MNILDPSIRLIDALAGWGLREAVRKYGMEVPSDESQRTMLGIDVVLRHVPELIARILLAEPLGVAEHRGVLRVDFGPEESDKLYLHNGDALTASLERLDARYVRTLIQTPDVAPLVCTVQVAGDETDPVWPAMIYDGWHRAAAWLIRAREGSPSRLAADLIKTKSPPARLTRPNVRLD